MIRFKTRRTKPNNSLEWTVKRIAQIVTGSSTKGPIGTNVNQLRKGEKYLDENGNWVTHTEDEHLKVNPDVFLQDNGSWNLGAGGNDWKLLPDDKMDLEVLKTKDIGDGYVRDDEFYYWIIDYRYLTDDRRKALEGLTLFLEWELGDT